MEKVVPLDYNITTRVRTFVKCVLTDKTHETRNNSVILGKNVHTSARKV